MLRTNNLKQVNGKPYSMMRKFMRNTHYGSMGHYSEPHPKKFTGESYYELEL
jgi:hypothetical protein